jgi:hypothetical protein
MNLYQAVLVAFAILVVAMIIWAISAIIRSPALRLKPLWIAGSLFGFPIGLGIDWTTPNDLVWLFGITVPPITAFTVLATGQIIIKTGFPIGAIAALIAVRESAQRGDADGTLGDGVR